MRGATGTSGGEANDSLTTKRAPDQPPQFEPPKGRSGWLTALQRLARNPLTLAGMLGMIAFVLIGLTATSWIPYPEHISGGPNLKERLQPPGAEHWFGTDNLGRDIFSRAMAGTGLSLRVGVIVVVLSATIGSVLGAFAGYIGGWLDAILMRVTDGFLAFPALVLAFAVAATLGPSLLHALMAITIVWWPWYARLVRSTTLQVRKQEYVDAARAIGGGTFHIVRRHVLPNCLVPILVQASMDFGYVVLTAASMSFIGVGAQPPQPEWGLMVNTGRGFFPDWWWMATFPGLAIFLAVLAFNLFGDGLRDVLDPRMSRNY